MRQTHKILFEDVYPTWAGQDRSETAPNLRVHRSGMSGDFAHPDDIEPLVSEALDASKEHKAGKIYTFLAYAHPFLDGNGRTIMIVQDEVMRRQNKHIVWGQMDKNEYLNVLTQELRAPNRGAMDDYMDHYVRDGALTIEESLNKIQEIAFDRSSKPKEPLTLDRLISSFIGQMKNPEGKAAAIQKLEQMRTRKAEVRRERLDGFEFKKPDFDIGDD